jgi:cysteinyl-tRNA synthetase
MDWRSWFSSGTPTAPLRFYNTLSKQVENFTTLRPKQVRMYNCGPTVYDRQHIGNLSAAVFADTLRRALEYVGYTVKQTINITDFGHLVSDGDEGEDKMTKGLRREGKTLTMENMREMATKYMELYFDDLDALGVDRTKIQFPRASDYIPQQIAMIQTLEEKGYAYRGKDGVYFDTSRFPRYGCLGGIDLEGLKAGARVAVHEDKRNPADFLLWKNDAHMGWDSVFGKGFPGWHIECSAMARATLGEQIDIHTGGIEHIPVHHNNEIAQSECATGKHPFARFWLHRAHIRLNDAKMAKSDGNVAYLSDIREKGFTPAALRYLFLTSHYRTPANFTWEALGAAQQALTKLARIVQTAPENGAVPAGYAARLRERFSDDLDTPGAIALLWEAMKDAGLSPAEKRALALDADRVLGLGLLHLPVPEHYVFTAETGTFTLAGSDVAVEARDTLTEVRTLLTARAEARAAKDWQRSDELRTQISALGYEVKDAADTQEITKIQI